MESLPETDLALAGGAIVLVLLDKLIQRGLITRGEGLSILETAKKRCDGVSTGAADLIEKLHNQMSRRN